MRNACVFICKRTTREIMPTSLKFDIGGITFRNSERFSFFLFSLFFSHNEVTCDKATSRRILEICTCCICVDRVALIKIAIRGFLPAAPQSAIFKVDIVQRRMQDAERLRLEFCCSMHISLSGIDFSSVR